MIIVVVFVCLLQADVGEVDEGVVDLSYIGRVLDVAEAREAVPQVHAQRSEGGYQDVYSEVELCVRRRK